MIKTAAPGKIIISGEHAVVYGKPALVMAMDRFSFSQIEFTDHNQIEINLPDYDVTTVFSWQQISHIAQQLETRYRQFLDEKLEIGQVIQKPEDVFIYLLQQASRHLQTLAGKGIRFNISSQLAAGSGNGSSASTIMSAIKAIHALLDNDIDKDAMYKLGLAAENLLHGRSSGVDPYICTHGGVHRFVSGKSKTLPPVTPTFFVANSGTPASGTGHCVDHVRKHFGNSGIWTEFEETTRQLETAMINKHTDDLMHMIKTNHRLLCRIGVVPDAVRDVVHIIEKQGAAAKISGAGSVTGPAAGAILIYDPEHRLDHSSVPYPITKINLEVQGVRIL